MDIANLIQTIAVYALPVLFAMTMPEVARGYAARHFGDDTATTLGRLTLNPLRHLDLVGTTLMPLLMYFATSGSFILGYCKPIPIRSENMRDPKRDMLWVNLAGPGSSVLQALLWKTLFLLFAASGLEEPFFLKMCQGGVAFNLMMFAFNLFPVPPLVGGKILTTLLPDRYAATITRIEPWGFFLVLALIIVGVVSTFWMQPIMALTYGLLDLLLTPLALLLS